MRKNQRPIRKAPIVVTGKVPITAQITAWEVELMAAALASGDEPIDRPQSDYDKGGSHGPAQP